MAAPERFLCDGMLGSLARWLRILGFDAAYAGSELRDDEILDWAAREERFLVTRDFEMVQRAMRRGLPVLLLKAGTIEEQLLILLMHSGAHLDPKRFFTRCTACAAVLETVPAAEVADRVPPAVLAQYAEFSRCPRCHHVYWEGSHVTVMERRIVELARKLSEGA